MADQSGSRTVFTKPIFGSFATTAATIFLGLATSVILARTLEPEGRGLLVMLTFWPAIAAGITNLSLNEAGVLHLANLRATAGEDYVRSYQRSLLALQVGLALLAGCTAVGLLALARPRNLEGRMWDVLSYAAIFVPLSILDLHFKAMLQGAARYKALNALRMIQPVCYVVGLAGCALTTHLDVEAAMRVMLAALLISMAAGSLAGGVGLSLGRSNAVRPTVNTGLKLHAANILLYSAAESDRLIAVLLLQPTTLGYYAVAVAVSTLGSGLIINTMSVFLSTEIAAAKTPCDRNRLIVRTVNDSWVLLLVVGLIFACITPWVIPMLYGAEFASAVPLVLVLQIAGVTRGARQIIDKSMRAQGSTKVGMLGEITALTATLACCSFGVAVAGTLGMVWGVVVAQTLSLAVVIYAASATLKIPCSQLFPVNRRYILRVRRLRLQVRANIVTAAEIRKP